MEAAAPGPSVLAGLGAGALTGGITALAIALAKAFNPDTVRAIFIAVTPTLLDIVTFGRSIPVAAT